MPIKLAESQQQLVIPGDTGGGGTMPAANTIDMAKNGAIVGTRPEINLIPINHVSITLADNSVDNRFDATLGLTTQPGVSGTWGTNATIPVIVVDSQGIITSITTTTISSTSLVLATRSIVAGTGLSGGGSLSVDRTLNIADTGVLAGTYGSIATIPQIVINAQGQITSAVSQNITTSSIVVATRSIVAGTGLSGGGDLTVDRTLNIANTGVVTGTYGSAATIAQFIVNAQGQLTSATSINISTSSLAIATRSIVAGTGLSGGGDLSVDRTLNIADTGVSTGTYGSISTIPQFIVNAQGQLTSVTSVNISTTSLAIATRSIVAGTGLSGGGDLSADRTLNIANTGVVTGTYGSSTVVPVFIVNSQGQLTSVTTSTVSATSNSTGLPIYHRGTTDLEIWYSGISAA